MTTDKWRLNLVKFLPDLDRRTKKEGLKHVAPAPSSVIIYLLFNAFQVTGINKACTAIETTVKVLGAPSAT